MAGDYSASPLAQVFEDVYETYKRQTGGAGPPRNLVPLERTAQTAASTAITALERRMTWLATIGATAPFVGLFGTVMGVVDAFHRLGTAGAAALRQSAGHQRGAHYDGGGFVCGCSGGGGVQPVSARIRIFASATDDFCRELAELARRDAAADASDDDARAG